MFVYKSQVFIQEKFYWDFPVSDQPNGGPEPETAGRYSPLKPTHKPRIQNRQKGAVPGTGRGAHSWTKARLLLEGGEWIAPAAAKESSGFLYGEISIQKNTPEPKFECVLAGAVGLEPTTNGFGDRDSTN